MTKNSDGSWSVTVTVPQAAANTLDAVFFCNDEWDNNNSGRLPRHGRTVG